MTTTTKLPMSRCLNCGKEVTAASSLKNNVPTPGDFTVCLYCGHLHVFADDMTLREPTDSELLDIAGNQELLEVQKALAATDRGRRK